MTDGDWRALIQDFVDGGIDEAEFHDRFFDCWHRAARQPDAYSEDGVYPKAIETLFFVVEAYCPDPALRDANSVYEADAAELRQAAHTALAHLAPSPR